MKEEIPDMHRFIEAHGEEFEPVVSEQVRTKLVKGEPLTTHEVVESVERIETKVFTWEADQAQPDAKRVLLEAAQPASFQVVKPLISVLEHDNRCRALTLVTDNVAGERFMQEHSALNLVPVRDAQAPVLADIRGSFDTVLLLDEPSNSPNTLILYGGESVYGTEGTRLIYLVSSVFSHTARELFTGENARRADAISVVGVANEFSKKLFNAAIPHLGNRVVVVGSVLLEQLKQTLVEQDMFASAGMEANRRATRARLGIPEEAVLVLYSGFPSMGYVAEAQKVDGETLNQKTFARTLQAVVCAARSNPDSHFALAIRTHPRASGKDNDLRIPGTLPSNVTVVWAQSPEVAYDTIASASDVVACQSTSTELLYAPYRGVITAVSGYDDPGMQADIDEQLFGRALDVLKSSHDLVYVDSIETLTELLLTYKRPERRPFPDSPIPHITDLLLAL